MTPHSRSPGRKRYKSSRSATEAIRTLDKDVKLKLNSTDLAKIGAELYAFAEELYPICRSITGEGIRRTLAMIQKRIPLELSHVPTGTRVFDWTVPKEWNIRDAYIKIPGGERVV